MVSYLASYANRVVIANDRLIKIEDGQVFFRYKDYRDDSQWKTHQMPGVAFLAQFLRHTLPPGLHNKRRYGFWGDQVRTKNLARIREQLGVPPVEIQREEVEEADEPLEDAPRPRHCAVCKGELEYVGGTHRAPAPIERDLAASLAAFQRCMSKHTTNHRATSTPRLTAHGS